MAFSSARACNWCIPDAPLPELKAFEQDNRVMQARSHVISRWEKKKALEAQVIPKEDVVTQRLLDERKTIPEFLLATHQPEKQPTSRFYNEFLSKYYPRADAIITHLAPCMCPAAMKDMVQALVYLMSKKNRALYFTSDTQSFSFEYVHVEILGEQLHKYADMLTRATYTEGDEHVGFVAYGKPHTSKSLLGYWKRSGERSVNDLFALRADYVIALCYQAVKFYTLKGAYTDICFQYRRLARSVSPLKGSRYEHLYTEKVKLYLQLMKQVQVKLYGRGVS